MKKKSDNSQVSALLAHFKKHKRITSLQCVLDLGITSFHRRMSDLKERGYAFDSAWIKVRTRHGNGYTRVLQYTLKSTGAK